MSDIERIADACERFTVKTEWATTDERRALAVEFANTDGICVRRVRKWGGATTAIAVSTTSEGAPNLEPHLAMAGVEVKS